MYYIYILRSVKDRRHYIGCTGDINKRLKHHNNGEVKSTVYRRPLKLIYKETAKSFIEAHKRELEIKRMKGGVQFKKLLESAGVAQW